MNEIKINLTKTELLNLIVDLQVFEALIVFNKIQLDKERNLRVKTLIKKLKRFYLK